MEPVVVACELCSEEGLIVPGVDGQAWQEEFVVAGSGRSDDCGDAVPVALLIEEVPETLLEVAVGFGEGERIGEGVHGVAELVLHSRF